MGSFIDLTGQRCGLLTVIKRRPKHATRHEIVWLCQCDCGQQCLVCTPELRQEHTKSCGCMSHIWVGNHSRTHGLSNHPLYLVFKQMHKRCYNPNDQAYLYYGKRKIDVSPEWHNFENFYQWCVQNNWKDGLTIDRMNNNKGYSPNNCRIVTYSQNCRNKRNNLKVTWNRKVVNLIDLVESISPVTYRIVTDRLHKLGWPLKEAILTPKMEVRSK